MPCKGGSVMFVIVIVRVFIFTLIAYTLLKLVQHFRSPKRKLVAAQEHQQFFVVDEKTNIRKNFLLTYKGILFEGEKYSNPNEPESLSITMVLTDPSRLHELQKQDFKLLESHVHDMYPNAPIRWKSPVREFLH